MRILLSVKPEFAEKIMVRTKRYEYRKQLFKNKDVHTVVVYASSPVGKVMGEFEILNVMSGRPEEIWEKTRTESGITADFYFKYFSDTEMAHAIKIGKVALYPRPLELDEIQKGLKPPQSFRYIN